MAYYMQVTAPLDTLPDYLRTQPGAASALHVEETLPSYVTAIPACWRLYFDGGMTQVEHVLPDYLRQLSGLAQQPSRYQKIAANCASQAYQLFWLLALQHQDFGTALAAIKQAFSYGELADDNHLRVASLVRQAHVFFHLKQPIQQKKHWKGSPKLRKKSQPQWSRDVLSC